ncbi:evolutionarily conserved signaling intermediate in Toll pathway, mitochondrial [Nephila pilipes]|uniref:Evolutionarily conserved signaling intermediate in Toll pathway, mitochondrial n=1 Tax=Nephila pilipes TaxID=299642 RepID=A0A8X6PI30_NEPPI|nr:evolutionarily conserved signaling intermediate in Toll pathway, mitochondrial [Nephila pilipes]
MLIHKEFSLRCSSAIVKTIYYNHSICLQSQNLRKLHTTSEKLSKFLNSFQRTQFSKIHFTKSNLIKKSLQEVGEDKVTTRDHFFLQVKKKDRETFLKILDTYDAHDTIRRGHVEMIYAAMKYMDDFGVPGDLAVYKKIMDVFPKGRFIPKNLIQAEFFHFFRHQECALFVLDKMEYSGICPDKELGEIIVTSFGKSSHVYKKYARMLYWMPKLKNINPHKLPDPLPDDVRELARLALKKMSVDKRTKIEEYNAEHLEDSIDKTWIMSAQSPDQRKLIEEHQEDKAIYVEGPSLVWLRKISITYYTLCADPKFYPVIEEDEDDISNLPLYMFGDPKPKSLTLKPKSVHEQEDATILGMCCTGTSSKDSVLSWIRFLRKSNPKLDQISVLLKIRSSPSTLVAVNTYKEDSTEKESSSDGDAEETKS